MDRANTLPLFNRWGAAAAPLQERVGTWTKTAEVVPHANIEQERVCYPRLAPWSLKEDGPRELSGAAAEKARELKSANRTFGGEAALQGTSWAIHVEMARRRRQRCVVEGSTPDAAEQQQGEGGEGQKHVPTVMLLVYNKDGTPSPEDIAIWTRACRDVVTFLRDHDAAYFGVEIIHYKPLYRGLG